MSGRVLWTLPRPSQECAEGPVLRQPTFDSAVLAYDFETDSGAYAWEEIHFTGAVAVRFTFTEVCTPEQVAAYDKLVEAEDLSWLSELHEPRPGLHHYRIYFDDVGCYEFLAGGFVPPVHTPEG